MQRLALFLLLVLALLAASAATGRTDATAARCGQWSVPARLAGSAVCLRDNRTCKQRLAARYRSYGFECVNGTLLTRWSYLRRRPLGRVGAYSGLGRGPAYPIGTHSIITMRFPPPEGWGSEWSGTKRVWLLDLRYAGRALPVAELPLEGNSSLTRLRAPGCYAYQVDGRTFSYLVVFEARLEGPAKP